jgi:hypothetical protein
MLLVVRPGQCTRRWGSGSSEFGWGSSQNFGLKVPRLGSGQQRLSVKMAAAESPELRAERGHPGEAACRSGAPVNPALHRPGLLTIPQARWSPTKGTVVFLFGLSLSHANLLKVRLTEALLGQFRQCASLVITQVAHPQVLPVFLRRSLSGSAAQRTSSPSNLAATSIRPETHCRETLPRPQRPAPNPRNKSHDGFHDMTLL